ncbi:terpene synthase [Morchella conica CCBAS932]|uniref:Terpene cyclase/mutase family member n=1 Tax=Morchella conica CCBAS932 TaxID=1392247 RepID=A0A3N4KD91_9PEZI|nr:terpene synthase [Morchella conica CCBAS932]
MASPIPVSATIEKTDYTRWRLRSEDGRQTWHYLTTDKELAAWPQSVADKYHLGLPTDLPSLPPAHSPLDAARNGLSFFSHLQMPEGQWACEYGGPMFLIPAVIIAHYVTNTPIPDPWKIELKAYLSARAHPVDGGWGLHIEGDTSVFGTACNYTVLRILGMDPTHPVATKARNTLHKLGGALGSPHWGKFMLALLGCYAWEGMNPIPPELWLLPTWIPFHPWRWWCHNRLVYLAMSYMYSLKRSHPENELTRSLREELYTQPYASIDFAQHRNTVAPGDIYHPHTKLLDALNGALGVWGSYLCPGVVQKVARDHVYELIKREDEASEYCCLGPVNSPFNLIARYFAEGEDSDAVRAHRETLKDFLWVKNEGMLVNGTDGVQCWDTSFLIQAIYESNLAEAPEYRAMLIKALQFLETQQIRADVAEADKAYRHQRKGAWPFSKRTQGYTVSDTTAEALKSVLMLQSVPGMPQLIGVERLQDAVDVLLTMQNPNGGFGTYELARGGKWLEALNAAEVFGGIMIEYEYPECTTAVVMGLSYFRKTYPRYRAAKIDNVIRRAVAWIKGAQRDDGSWYGSWGICFTYAIMFAVEALRSVGEICQNSAVVRRACEFLVSKQREDGGWGESYRSSETGVYTQHRDSQVVNTAWAVIALMHAEWPDVGPIERGIRLLMARQRGNGEWAQEAIEGVFNKSCMISYPNYKFTFTIKALGMYARLYRNPQLRPEA